MSGRGFAQRVTLDNLEEFGEYLSQPRSGRSSSSGRSNPVRASRGLFDGESIGLRMRYQRPRRSSVSITDPTDDVSPTVISLAGRQSLWRKRLAASDCQRQAGNPTGGVRLTQAGFHDPSTGRLIDNTSYFRNLFGWATWSTVKQSPFVEEASVPFHVILRGHDFGTINMTISHKPAGEAGQRNYTTILRWTGISNEVRDLNLTGRVLELYEPESSGDPYLLTVD